MTDEIIREVWLAKEAIAKRFHFDMDALAAELRKQQKESGRKVVNLKRETVPDSSHQHQ